MERLHTGHNIDIAPNLRSNPKVKTRVKTQVKTQVKTVAVGGVGCRTGRGWCGDVHARSSDPANINRLAGSEGALKHHSAPPAPRSPGASQKSRSTSRSRSRSTSKSKPCRSGRPAADLFGLTRSRCAAYSKRSGLGCHKAQSILVPGATRRYLVALWHPGTECSGRVAHKARTACELVAHKAGTACELVAHKARTPFGRVAHKGTRSSRLCGTRDGFERGAEGMARVVTADGVGK